MPCVQSAKREEVLKVKKFETAQPLILAPLPYLGSYLFIQAVSFARITLFQVTLRLTTLATTTTMAEAREAREW
jgi:hypothetical protein